MSLRRLVLLGGFRLLDGRGREVSVASRKARAVLALVALGPAGGVPRERVAGRLWGGSDDPHARQSLRQALSDLRRDAGALLDATGQRLSLAAAACTVDVHDFAERAGAEQPGALEQALALYAGPLLDGLTLDDAPEFEDWLQAERQRLEALARDAFERLLARHAAAGEHDALARVAERAVAFDPAEETAWHCLIGALHDAGHPHRALQAFERCCDALRRSVDAAPSPATLALVARIRREARARTSGPDDAGSRAGPPTAAARARPLPLVAVMPFEALAPAEPGVAASLSHELVGALARIAGFGVVDGRVLFRGVDAASADGRALVREQRVAFIVAGRLERGRGTAWRLSVHLLDGASGRHCWSRRIDLDDASPEGRDELVAQTVARIEPQIVLARHALPAADADADDDDPWRRMREAFAALFARGWSEEAIETAVQRYRAAIRADPGLALAYAHMALVLAIGARMGLVAGDAPLLEAREAADRAIALAPHDSEVLGCAGCAITDLGDPLRGEVLLERAVEENPDNPQAWAALGACRLNLAQVEAGLQSLARGVRIGSSDYRRTLWLTLMSRAYLQTRRTREATEAARSAIRCDPSFYPAWLALAAVRVRAGQGAQATRAIAQALRIRPRLRPEEAHAWIGPRMAARLRDVWPAAAAQVPPLPAAGAGNIPDAARARARARRPALARLNRG